MNDYYEHCDVFMRVWEGAKWDAKVEIEVKGNNAEVIINSKLKLNRLPSCVWVGGRINTFQGNKCLICGGLWCGLHCRKPRSKFYCPEEEEESY